MSKSCTILAHVRNSKGEIVESRLFNDLLHYTSNNRALAKEYYAVGTNEEFLSLYNVFYEIRQEGSYMKDGVVPRLFLNIKLKTPEEFLKEIENE